MRFLTVVSAAMLATCLTALTAGEASAWPFGRSVSRTSTVTRTVNVYASPQAECSAKAAKQAANCRMAHLGGGFGGANAEGVGCAMTAQAALNACCFTGKRRLAASAVVRGRNGMYYACKVFW